MKTRTLLFVSAVILLAISVEALQAAPSTPLVPIPNHGGLDTLPMAPAPEPECVVKAKVLRGTAGVEQDEAGCGGGRVASMVSNGDSFGAGATISTGEGSLVELSLPDGSVLRIGPNSMLTISTTHCEDGDSPFSFRLMMGAMWSKVAPAMGGDTKMNVETDNAVTGVRGTIFMVETYMLDTVFHKRVIDMYPPELRGMLEGIDTNMVADAPFRGNVTRVAVFEGSVEVTERLTDKTTVVEAGNETIAGVQMMPMSAMPMGGRKGFDMKGEFAE